MRGGLKTGSHQTLPLFLVLHSFKHHEIPKLDRIEKKRLEFASMLENGLLVG